VSIYRPTHFRYRRVKIAEQAKDEPNVIAHGFARYSFYICKPVPNRFYAVSFVLRLSGEYGSVAADDGNFSQFLWWSVLIQDLDVHDQKTDDGVDRL
jgi:hypothetical protein